MSKLTQHDFRYFVLSANGPAAMRGREKRPNNISINNLVSIQSTSGEPFLKMLANG